MAGDIKRQLSRGSYEHDAEIVIKAFSEALRGKPTVITDGEANIILRNYSTEIRKKTEEKRKEDGEKAKVAGEAFLAANKAKATMEKAQQVLEAAEEALETARLDLLAKHRSFVECDTAKKQLMAKLGGEAASGGLPVDVKLDPCGVIDAVVGLCAVEAGKAGLPQQCSRI